MNLEYAYNSWSLLAVTIPHEKEIHGHTHSMLKKVEHSLAPYVSFIMPVFALANAGVNLEGVIY